MQSGPMVEVTHRSRFAFAWTNQPTQTQSGSEVLPPSDATLAKRGLGWKQLDAELYDATKYNRGNDWACSVWVRVRGEYRKVAWSRSRVESWLLLWQCSASSQDLKTYMLLES